MRDPWHKTGLFVSWSRRQAAPLPLSKGNFKRRSGTIRTQTYRVSPARPQGDLSVSPEGDKRPPNAPLLNQRARPTRGAAARSARAILSISATLSRLREASVPPAST